MNLKTMTYTINIAPIAWKRAGLYALKNADFHFYDKQKHEKLACGLFMTQQHGLEPKFEGPIEIDVTFYMPIPKSVPKRTASPFHFKTPDLDNLLKFLLDMINSTETIWIDDCIVSKIIAQKIYSKNPRTTFTITQLD